MVLSFWDLILQAGFVVRRINKCEQWIYSTIQWPRNPDHALMRLTELVGRKIKSKRKDRGRKEREQHSEGK